MMKALFRTLILLPGLLLPTAQAATTTTTTTTQRVTYNVSSPSTVNATTYSDGIVTKVYQDGGVLYYQGGNLINAASYGGLKTKQKAPVVFDLRNRDSMLQKDVFSKVWQAFRLQYSLNDKGKYVRDGRTETPAHKLSLNLFLLFAADQQPELNLEKIVACNACAGKGHKVGVGPNNLVGEYTCDFCGGIGKHIEKETFLVSYTGQLPATPTLAELIESGLVNAAPEPAPKAAPRIVIPMAVADPAPAEKPKLNLSAEQKFASLKASAQAGDRQAQYEVAMIYAHESSDKPVARDNFEAAAWMEKAAKSNHKMAQFHLGTYYEKGLGVDRNLELALKWRRSSALLGCKQAQRWMGHLYWGIFNNDNTFAALAIDPKDPGNLPEAYAWFSLAADTPMPTRADPNTPSEEELKSGEAVLNSKDFFFERTTMSSTKKPRDDISNQFTSKKQLVDAKSRAEALAAEAASYQTTHRAQ